jgi:Zn-dependent protease
VLFALAEPVAFVALVASFLLALAVRSFAIRVTRRVVGLANPYDRALTPRVRDIDPFGAVAAAVGGQGWGRPLSVDEVPRHRGRGRAALVFLAGPLACIALAQLCFLAYALTTSFNVLSGVSPSDLLRGFPLSYTDQFLTGLGVGLLTFGLLALIPIPPLDGFGWLWNAQRAPGPGMQWMRLWFEDKNIGVLVLLICCFFPLSSPLLLMLLDFLGLLFVRLWG